MLLSILPTINNAIIYTIIASGIVIAYFNFKQLKAVAKALAEKRRSRDEEYIDGITKEIEEHISCGIDVNV